MPSAAHKIRTAAVLGAGTMGAQIAAHLANAGYPVQLLDVSHRRRAKASSAQESSNRIRSSRRRSSSASARAGSTTISIGSREADWIIEAVIENADAKRALLDRVDARARAGSIVSSNTSGLSIAGLAEGRSEDFRAHWLGTHFFNPPRYLSLLEIIPTTDTDPAVRRRQSGNSPIAGWARTW